MRVYTVMQGKVFFAMYEEGLPKIEVQTYTYL